MSATTTMTAREAYECDSTFRALVDCWAKERRCPLVLCDRIQELGMSEAMRQCAEWAATEPERPENGDPNSDERDADKEQLPPYPHFDKSNYVWATFPNRCRFSRDIPWGRIERPLDYQNGMTAADAILWLLQEWRA